MNDLVPMGKFSDNLSALKTDDGSLSAAEETARWIELVTKENLKYPHDLIKSLQDGVILCKLLNCLKGGCIKKINMMPTPVAYLDNLSMFQNVCREDFNMQECQLFDIRDLDDLNLRGTLESKDDIEKETVKRVNKIMVTIYWLSKCSNDYPPLRHDHNTIINNNSTTIDESVSIQQQHTQPHIHYSTPQQQQQHLHYQSHKHFSKRNNIDNKTKWQDNEIDWEKNFSAWKNKRKIQISSTSPTSHLPINNGVRYADENGDNYNGFNDQHLKSQHHNQQCHDQENDDEPPSPPNWDTHPEFKNVDDDDDDYDDGNVRSRKPANRIIKGNNNAKPGSLTFSSSSSSSSSLSPLVREYKSVDDVSKMVSRKRDGFVNLLIDVDKLNQISLSQSLNDLENFDEVGFEDDYQVSYHHIDGGDGDRCISGDDVHKHDITDDIDGDDNKYYIRPENISNITSPINKNLSINDDFYDGEQSEEEEEDDDDDMTSDDDDEDDNNDDDKENVEETQNKIVRKPLNFIGELIQLNYATKELDDVCDHNKVDNYSDTITFNNDNKIYNILTNNTTHNFLQKSDKNIKVTPSAAATTAFTTISSTHPLSTIKKPSSLSSSLSSSPSLPSSSSVLINSRMFSRFYHDMNTILSSNQSLDGDIHKINKLDFELEKQRIIDWNLKCDNMLHEKFLKERAILRGKLESDLNRAHDAERLRKIQEEEFLENEVIEKKNKKTLSHPEVDVDKEDAVSRKKIRPLSYYSYQALSDIGSAMLSNNLKRQSFFTGPSSSHSLTQEWLMNSCIESSRSEDGPTNLHTDDNIKTNDRSPPVEQTLPTPKTSDEVFDEPNWMSYVSDEVNKQSINMPFTKATLETISDSIDESNESLSADQSYESFSNYLNSNNGNTTMKTSYTTTLPSLTSRSTTQQQPSKVATEVSVATTEATMKSPLPHPDDSLLSSRHQLAYLSSETSTSYINNKQTTQPSSLLLSPTSLSSLPQPTLTSSPLKFNNKDVVILTHASSTTNTSTSIASSVVTPSLPLKLDIITSSSSLHSPPLLSQSSQSPNVLLTPSSDRSVELCHLNPPLSLKQPRIRKKKLSDSDDNISSFSSSSKSSAFYHHPTTSATLPLSTPQYLYCDRKISSSVDHLFAYHDDQIKREYYWQNQTLSTNHVRIHEMPMSHRSEDKPSCSACGYCLGNGKSIKMYSLIGYYHMECFCCFVCKEPVDGNKQQLHIHKSIIMCDKCYKQNGSHRFKS